LFADNHGLSAGSHAMAKIGTRAFAATILALVCVEEERPTLNDADIEGKIIPDMKSPNALTFVPDLKVNSERGSSGTYEPINGGAPESMGVAAASSRWCA